MSLSTTARRFTGLMCVLILFETNSRSKMDSLIHDPSRRLPQWRKTEKSPYIGCRTKYCSTPSNPSNHYLCEPFSVRTIPCFALSTQ